MPAAHRVVLILVSILIVAAVAVLGLRAGGAEIGLGPEASPTTGPSASSGASPSVEPSVAATASLEASIPSEAEAQAILDEIEEQVIAIRGLTEAEIGPAEIISREELAEELLQLFHEEYPLEER
ncbi:MAG: hypothetical protein ACRDGB_04875, partial [Candidatus Limnocylindria bacterium]